MKEEEIRSSVEKKLGKKPFASKKTYLVISKKDCYPAVNAVLIAHLNSEVGPNGIVVSLSTPWSKLAKGLGGTGADPKKIYWVDATGISFFDTADPGKDMPNCAFVEAPRALSHLSIILTRLTAEGKHSYLLFDSVSALSLAVDAGSAEKFIDYLRSKMKALGIGGVLLSVEEGKAQALLSSLAKLCDKVIRL